jgi:hypothetical protein
MGVKSCDNCRSKRRIRCSYLMSHFNAKVLEQKRKSFSETVGNLPHCMLSQEQTILSAFTNGYCALGTLRVALHLK